jgi:calcium/calmodulin-dependent protein kinase (CaM kinase) II
MADATRTELLHLNQRLLDAIAAGDWAAYQELCDPSLTALEPEAPGGQVVEGLAFHRFYFDLGGIRGRHQTTMCNPRVRLMADVAVLCYVRLVQRLGPDGAPATAASAETRVWERRAGRWWHVHFHRSAVP